MAEKVIGFKINLNGKRETLANIKEVDKSVENFGKTLADLDKKQSAFDRMIKKTDVLIGKINALVKAVKAANRASGSSSGSTRNKKGTGGGSSPNNKPNAPNAPNSPQTSRQLLKEIKELKAKGKAVDDLIEKLAQIKNAEKELNEEIKAQQIQLKGNNLSVAELRAELKRLQAAGENYDDVTRKIAEAKEQSERLNAEIREQQRTFRAATEEAGSYKQVNAELVSLRDQFRRLSKENREGAKGQTMLKQIRQLDDELKEIDAQMGIYTRNVGNYKSAFDGLASAVSKGAAVFAISIGAEEIVEANVEISDSIANVAKTSNQTSEQVSELAERLKFRDTRTSLAEQLDIAEIGGRLGLAADELFGFTDAIDVAKVALGDQFNDSAEEVTNTLAGLRNVLVPFQSGDVGTDILRIGNALNILETKGTATAPVIADFVNRIGGAAVPLNATTESIFGLATTLDELQVRAERGGTAVVKLLTDVAASPEKYADLVQQAGLIENTETFVKLVQDDIVNAFALVTRAAAETGEKNTEFASILGDLGIKGSATTEVFAKLGANYDKLIARTATAKEALTNQASLTDEFNKKNENLAASVDKLRNSIINLTVSTGAQTFFADAISGVAKFIIGLAELPKFIVRNRVTILALIVAIVALNQTAIAARIAQLRLAAAQKFAAIQTKAITAAQWLLNAALTANPIGLVIAGVALLIAGFSALYNNSETVRAGINTLTQKMLDFYENNLLVKTALFILIEPLKIIFGLIAEGTGFLNGYVESLKILKTELSEGFNILVLNAEKFGLQMKAALSFGDAKDELKKEIREIEKDIKAATERVENARLNAEKERLKKISDAARKAGEAARAKDDERRAAELKDEIKNDEKIAESKINIKNLTTAELLKIANKEDTSLEALARKEIKRREDAAKAAKKAAEERLKAAENIAKLEIALIENRFDREIATSKNDAKSSLSSLIGSPEQIAEQTRLINTALDNQVAEINKKRQQALDDAKDFVRGIQDEVKKTVAQNAADESAGELSVLNSAFAFNTDVADRNAQRAIQALNEQLLNQEITRAEYAEQQKQIEQQKLNELLLLQVEHSAQKIQLAGEDANARIVQMQTEFELEKAEILRQQQERDNLINEKKENGDLDDAAAAEALAESAALAKEQEIAATRDLEQAKADVILEIANTTLSEQEALAQREIAAQKSKVDEILRLEQQKERIIASGAEALGQVIGRFYTGQEKDFKAFGKQILVIALDLLEKQALLAIAAATTREIGTKGFIGIGTGAILAGLIKGATAGLKGLVNSFEEGGIVGGQTTDGISGAGVPHQSGFVLGNPHQSGGVRVLSGGQRQEWEGGEYKLRNGAETYLINKRNAATFRETLQKISGQPNRFSIQRKMIASTINSANGKGTMFNAGGIVSPLTVNPLPVPAIASSSSADITLLRKQNELLMQNIIRIQEQTNAVNSRIDNLKVINDPAEIVTLGNEIKTAQNTSEL